jgi:ParB-like chromosome segregation protein Spo0J
MADRIEIWPVDQLVPYEGNPKVHSAASIDRLANWIRRVGFRNPILVASDSGIVAGHRRLAAARQLGMDQVPVIVLDDLSPEERQAYVTIDNKFGEDDGYDQQLLAAELSAMDVDLASLAFSDDDLRRLTDGLELGAFEQLSQPLAPGVERAEPEDQGPGTPNLDMEGDDADATDESGEVDERHVFSVSMRWDDREQVLMAVAAAKDRHGLEGTAEALAQVCREWLDGREG